MESGREVFMDVLGNLVKRRFKGEGAQRSCKPHQVAINVLWMAESGRQMVPQCRGCRAETMQEPVVGHVERGGAKFHAAGAATIAADGCDLLVDGLDQTMQQH